MTSARRLSIHRTCKTCGCEEIVKDGDDPVLFRLRFNQGYRVISKQCIACDNEGRRVRRVTQKNEDEAAYAQAAVANRIICGCGVIMIARTDKGN